MKRLFPFCRKSPGRCTRSSFVWDRLPASDALGGGLVNEVVVNLTRFTLIFREVDEDVVLVLALTPDGNIGKSRYLTRRYLRAIREEL